jgi:hypothetical protein
LQQRDESGDVVAVAAGQQDHKRNTAGVGDQMMLRAQPATVDRTLTAGHVAAEAELPWPKF